MYIYKRSTLTLDSGPVSATAFGSRAHGAELYKPNSVRRARLSACHVDSHYAQIVDSTVIASLQDFTHSNFTSYIPGGRGGPAGRVGSGQRPARSARARVRGPSPRDTVPPPMHSTTCNMYMCVRSAHSHCAHHESPPTGLPHAESDRQSRDRTYVHQHSPSLHRNGVSQSPLILHSH